MSAFDDFEAKPETRETRLARRAAEYFDISRSISELDKELEVKRQEIASDLPVSVGKHHESAGGFDIEVEYREVRHWDSATLESLFSTTVTPPFIRKKYSIPKEEWDALPPHERAKFSCALTASMGDARVKVRRK
jgi:hypothetical protein